MQREKATERGGQHAGKQGKYYRPVRWGGFALTRAMTIVEEVEQLRNKSRRNGGQFTMGYGQAIRTKHQLRVGTPLVDRKRKAVDRSVA